MNSFFIVGPTASGKSALALELAGRTGAVICSLDAFQVYRGLDIGTGKASPAEQKQIPHRLLDLVEPGDSYSVADYLKAAAHVLSQETGDRPLLWVGGTGLYLRALREGLSAAPGSDPELLEQLSTWPLERLQVEIQRLDPDWCLGADLKNPRRIIRALAVVLGSGRRLSDWQSEKVSAQLPDITGVFLQPDKEYNRQQITNRVHQMWEGGWPDEVRRLLKIEGWRESQSARAIGYLPVVEFLEGRMAKDKCQETIIQETAQYARRQVIWFRKEKNLQILSYSSHEDLTNLSRKILEEFSKGL